MLQNFFSSSHQHQYNQLRNKVRAATRFDFKVFVDPITEGLHQSSKPFWNWINKIRACRNPLPTINHKNQVITSDTAKANLLNQYFRSVLTNEDISGLPKLKFPTIAGFTFDSLIVSPLENPLASTLCIHSFPAHYAVL